MCKLHKLNIRGKIWNIIDDCHQNTESAVIVNQTKSRWFPVQQGVRQGGVLSSFLYLVFINDLLDELQLVHSNHPIIFDKNYHSPALADDIACIALSPSALQSMLDTASTYASKWRFEYNASKSSILSFRAKKQKPLAEVDIYLGQSKIQCGIDYEHLGISINSNTKSKSRISNACSKGWKSFYALSDLHISRINPATMAHLYRSVILPSVLYGCETWNHMTKEDVRRLNSLQHGICKQIFNLPKPTRSDIVEQYMNILPIKAEIDTRKLLFLGRLCRMNTEFLPKKIFTSRLFSFLYNLSETQMGFIPDVLQLLQTYQLTDYLNTWLSDGSFPSKSAWKSTVRSSVYTHQTLQRIERTAYDPDFFRFNAVFSTSNPFIMWQYINSYSEIQNLKFTLKLIASKPLQTSIACVLCGHFVTDVFSHATISCPALTIQHSNWWNSLTRSFTVHLEAELSGLPEDDLFLILLGKQTLTVLSQAEEIEFRKLNSRHVVTSCAVYNRLLG